MPNKQKVIRLISSDRIPPGGAWTYIPPTPERFWHRCLVPLSEVSDFVKQGWVPSSCSLYDYQFGKALATVEIIN